MQPSTLTPVLMSLESSGAGTPMRQHGMSLWLGYWLAILLSVTSRAGVLLRRKMFRCTRRVAAQGLVEYALILALVAVVVIGSVTTVGRRTSQVFDQVNCRIDGGEYHQDNGNGNSNRCDTPHGNGNGGGS